MNITQLILDIEKLKFHIRTVATSIDSDTHPVEALILHMDWSEADVNRAHDIFEKFDDKIENGDSINWGDFEGELKKTFNIGYQSVKYIVLAFYKNHQWTKVCHSYAMSFEPTTPVEFHQITRGDKNI